MVRPHTRTEGAPRPQKASWREMCSPAAGAGVCAPVKREHGGHKSTTGARAAKKCQALTEPRRARPSGRAKVGHFTPPRGALAACQGIRRALTGTTPGNSRRGHLRDGGARAKSAAASQCARGQPSRARHAAKCAAVAKSLGDKRLDKHLQSVCAKSSPALLGAD